MAPAYGGPMVCVLLGMPSFTAAAGPSRSVTVSARRSPRITTRRDLDTLRTESPLVGCQKKEEERDTNASTDAKDGATSVSNVDGVIKEKNKKSFSKADSSTPEKERRRSRRLNSPKVPDDGLTHASQLPELSKCNTRERSLRENTQVTSDACTFKNHGNMEMLIQDSKAIMKAAVLPSIEKSSKTRTKTSESLQVRELRKIEDYWTRKSPVTDSSPRLRSSSKAHNGNQQAHVESTHMSNLRDVETLCSSTDPAENDDLNQVNVQQDSTSLPESPVPKRISQRFIENKANVQAFSETCSQYTESTDLKDNQKDSLKLSPCDHSENRKLRTRLLDTQHSKPDTPTDNNNKQIDTQNNLTKPVSTRLRSVKQQSPNRNIPDVEALRTEHKTMTDVEIKHETAENELVTLCRSNYHPTLEELSTKDLAESDSEDDDYLPPRKKLRSEVTTDELWEGFPLTFSFKRLAPIRKQGSDNLDNNVEDLPNTSTAINKQVDEIKELYEDNDRDKTNKVACVYGSDDHMSLKSMLKSSIDGKQLDEKRMSQYLGKNMPWLRNRQVNSLLDNTKQKNKPQFNQETTKSSESTSKDTPLSQNTREKIKLTPEDVLESSTEICKGQKSTKKLKYAISPPVSTLKRSTRLQERLGQNSLTPEESPCKEPQIVSTTDSQQPPISESALSTGLRKDILKAKEITFTSDDTGNTLQHEQQQKSFEYTKLKEVDRKDMSILEILTHDFSEKMSSTSLISNDLEANGTLINLKNKEKEVNDSGLHEANVSMSGSTTDQMASESISETLSNLLKPKSSKETTELDANSGAVISTITGVPCEIKSTIINADTTILSDNCRETTKIDRTTRPEQVESSILDDTLEYTLSENQEKMTSLDLTRLKQVKDTTKSDKRLTDSFEHTNVKRKVPPLRIKLKPESSSQRKKPLKDTKEKSKSSNSSVKLKKNISKDDSERKDPKTPKSDSRQRKDQSDTPKEQVQNELIKIKKKSKQSSKRKKSSPNTSIMELRINNERRQSIVEDILSNPLLDKHACVIWSSENRRHAVLSRPDASHSEIDDILREKWENLLDKEKLRYFQRAKNAIKDENRHSSRKRDEEPKPEEATSNTTSDHSPTLARFLAMDHKQQLSELKKWLHFYHEVSLEEYNKVMSAFKENLQAIKTEKERLRNAETKTKQKSKKKSKTQQPKPCKQENDFDTQSQYRTILFEKIFDIKDKVIGIWKEKKKKQKEILHENFSGVVQKLITGERVKFSGNVTSGRLTEVLGDIKNLEGDRKLAVAGNDLHSESFQDLVDRLKDGMDSMQSENKPASGVASNAQKENMTENNDPVVDKLLSCVEDLPNLHPEFVQEVLTELNISEFTNDQKNARTSPSSILTSWVIADLLEDQKRQETVQKNTNNNRSQYISTGKNRELKSILNIADVRRKYGQTPSSCPNLEHSQNGSTQSLDTRSLHPEHASTGDTPHNTVPEDQFVNMSSPCLVTGTRPGIIAVQHFDNGVPVVRYARVNPITQARILNQYKKLRFGSNARCPETQTKHSEEANVDSCAKPDIQNSPQKQASTETESTYI